MSPNWGLPWMRSRDSEPEGGPPDAESAAMASSSADAPRFRGDGQTETPTVEGVMEALRDVFDPELAINIVDLGLVYGVEIDGSSVEIRMTLTSPGCPIGPMLQAMVQGAVQRSCPQVENVRVELVWDPPWDPYKMASEEARDMLGIW